jgi:hypothetical protein
MADRLSDAFVRVRDKMLSGAITPEGVAREVGEFTPEVQLARVYENHRALQRRRYGARAAGAA